MNINVVLVDFPVKGKEIVMPNEDNSFTILINARLSRETQIAAYRHAMKHILQNDFEKQCVQEIEYLAHCNNNNMTQKNAAAYYEHLQRRKYGNI